MRADEPSRPGNQNAHTWQPSTVRGGTTRAGRIRHSSVRVDHDQLRLACPGMPIDVVLPCLNEAAALPWVLARMPAGYRAIVADNGSDDGSSRIARSHGAVVVHVPQRGFGAAC